MCGEYPTQLWGKVQCTSRYTMCAVPFHAEMHSICRNLTLLCSLFPKLSLNYLVILHPASVSSSLAISSMPLSSFDCSFWCYTVFMLTVKVFHLQDKPFSVSDNTFLLESKHLTVVLT